MTTIMAIIDYGDIIHKAKNGILNATGKLSKTILNHPKILQNQPKFSHQKSILWTNIKLQT